MGKHIYVFYGDLFGQGEFGRSTFVGEKPVPRRIAEACTISFTTEEGTFHYQAEYKTEALAYLETKGVQIPTYVDSHKFLE